jgi:hypothetical protein
MLRIYCDGSVLSALFDDRAPDRRAQTREFWARRGEFELSTCELTREELSATPDHRKRDQLLRLVAGPNVHAVTSEMRALAGRYVAAGVFAEVAFADGLHVAVAVLTRQDLFVSWNFRHLVNRRRRAMINQVNVAASVPLIEIVAPPEV